MGQLISMMKSTFQKLNWYLHFFIRSDYILRNNDHIAYRYRIVEEIGKGSFGKVIQAYDHKQNRSCALKMIKSKKKFYSQALIEIRILKFLRDKDPDDDYFNIKILNYFQFRNHIVMFCNVTRLMFY